MKNLKKNSNFLLLAIGVVLFWRGIWGLADIYLFPNNPTLSLVVSVIIGLIILLVVDWKHKDLRELA